MDRGAGRGRGVRWKVAVTVEVPSSGFSQEVSQGVNAPLWKAIAPFAGSVRVALPPDTVTVVAPLSTTLA